LLPNVDFLFSHKCLFEILSVFLKTQIMLGQGSLVSGSYLNPSLLGVKNIGREITHGILILLNGDAQKIKVITGGEITCPLKNIELRICFSIFL
jgi:hypothetical protein